MKRRTRSSSTLAGPAGLWLRCFLGGALWVLLSAAVAPPLIAQIDLPAPVRLSRVEGRVVDPAGHPVVDVEVSLVRPDAAASALKNRTDQSGEFHFEHVKGDYILRVARSTYAPAERAIVVTDEIVTTLERKRLYVILGPGACMDACSAVLTSKKEFERAIRAKNKH